MEVRSIPENQPSSSEGLVRAYYPPPIAAAFARTLGVRESDMESAVRTLHDTLLSYLGLLAWRAAGAGAQAGLPRPARFTGGQWLGLMRESSARLSPDEHEFVFGREGGGPGSFARSPLHAVLAEAVELRNSVLHGRRHDQRAAWRSKLHAALDLICDLRRHILFVPRRVLASDGRRRTYECGVYRGDERGRAVRIETDCDLPLDRAYLWHEHWQSLLPLGPLIVETNAEPGSLAPELFYVEDLEGPLVVRLLDGSLAGESVLGTARSRIREADTENPRWIHAQFLRAPELALASRHRHEPADMVDGRYEIVGHLGSGGSAEVYEAVDLTTRTPVALKVLPLEAGNLHDSRARLRKEIQIARRVEHRHLVRYLDWGDDRGAEYVTTALATGWAVGGERARTLAQYLTATSPDRKLAEPEVRAIALQIAQGLAALHENGIVHRDLKPSNVLLFEQDGERVVKIGDFGIAREAGQRGLTLAGIPRGTPEYMPPEQTDDDVPAPTMDVYAFGAVVYEMVAGAPPFRGRTEQATREAHRNKRLEPLESRAPGVSRELGALVKRWLAKSPAGRRCSNGLESYRQLLAIDSAPQDATVDVLPGRTLGSYAIGPREADIPGATLFRAVDTRSGHAVHFGILADLVEQTPSIRDEAVRRISVLQQVRRPGMPGVREYGEEDGYTWFVLDTHDEKAADGSTGQFAQLAERAHAISELHAHGLHHGRIDALFAAEVGSPGVPVLLRGNPTAVDEDWAAFARAAREECQRWIRDSTGHDRRVARAARLELDRRLRRDRVDGAALVAWTERQVQRSSRRGAWDRARVWPAAHPVASVLLALALVVPLGSFGTARILHERRVQSAIEDSRRAYSGQQGREALALLQAARRELGPHPDLDGNIALLRIVMDGADDASLRSMQTLVDVGKLRRADDGIRLKASDFLGVFDPIAAYAWCGASLDALPALDPHDDETFWLLALELTRRGIDLTSAPAPAPDVCDAFACCGLTVARSRRRPVSPLGWICYCKIAGVILKTANDPRYARLHDEAVLRPFVLDLMGRPADVYNEYALSWYWLEFRIQDATARGEPLEPFRDEVRSFLNESRLERERSRVKSTFRSLGSIDTEGALKTIRDLKELAEKRLNTMSTSR